MTLSTTGSRASFSGNDATTEFSFPYQFLEDADLVVVLIAENGVETTQVLDTDYTVSGEGESGGGTVTMDSAPATGESLVIYRDPGLTQDLDLVENDPLPVEEIEARLDKLTMICQRLSDQMERSVRLSDTDISGFDPILPTGLSEGSTLVVNADEDGFEEGAVPDQVQVIDAGPYFGDGSIEPTDYAGNSVAPFEVAGLSFDHTVTKAAKVTVFTQGNDVGGGGCDNSGNACWSEFYCLYVDGSWNLVGLANKLVSNTTNPMEIAFDIDPTSGQVSASIQGGGSGSLATVTGTFKAEAFSA